jgi:hydrogenase-4 component F
MTVLLLLPVLAPLAAAALAAILGWRPLSASMTVLSALSILVSGVLLGLGVESEPQIGAVSLLRADALSVTMLIVIGTVGTLATWASIGYLDAELAHRHTDQKGANLYGVLVPIFLSAMALAVLANNIGV